MVQDAVSIGRAFKGVEGFEDKRLETYRSSQNIEDGNLDGNEIEFFPKNPSGSDADNNYISKPFVGGRKYWVGGVKIETNHHVLKDEPTEGNIDLVPFYNQLVNAIAVLEGASNRREALRVPLVSLMEVELHDYSASAYEDSTNNAGFRERIEFHSTRPLLLDEPLVIGQSEVFKMRIKWDDTSNFPTHTEWGNLGQGGPLKLTTKMQVAYNDD